MRLEVGIDSIIFDLDGTLWNASAVSARGWNNALRAYPEIDCEVTAEQVCEVSGLPFAKCVAVVFGDVAVGLDMKGFEASIDDGERHAFQTEKGSLYPSVISGIEEISKHYRLFLVSNCQAWYLEAFWRQFGLKRFFEHGTCYGESGRPKHEMISAVKRDFSLANPIYIGDTVGDLESARRAGVAFLHAAYGFGTVDTDELAMSSFGELLEWSRSAAA